MKKKSFALGYSMVVNWFLAWVFYNFTCTVSLSVFRGAVAEMNGFSTALVLKLATPFSIAIAFLLPVMPKMLSRFGSRYVSGTGSVVGGLCYLLIPFSPNAVIMAILIALTNLMAGLYCTITTMVMVSKWFPRKKGTVMGIITSAGIVSSSVMLPIFNMIYTNMSITGAMIAIGALQIIYGIATFFWLRDTPEECGLLPDNMPMTEEEKQQLAAAANTPSTWTYGTCVKSVKFWLVSLGWSIFVLGMCCLSMVSAAALTGNGMPYNLAITIMSALGVITFVSSIVSGMLDTKIGVIPTSVIVTGIMAVTLLILGIGGANIPIWLMVVCFMITLGFSGAPNNLFSSQILSLFGPLGYSTAYSLFLVITNLKFVASYIDGASLSATGSYNMAIIIGGVLEIVGIVLFVLAGSKKLPDPDLKKKAEA